MSIQLKEENGGTMLAVCVSGKYFSNIERRAVAGQREWQKGLATFFKPLTTAAIRYFDRADADVARTRLAGDTGKQYE